jgi:uncharacterized protein YjbI with pentapeptide repeats
MFLAVKLSARLWTAADLTAADLTAADLTAVDLTALSGPAAAS